MKAKQNLRKLTPEEDHQLARIAGVLRGDYGGDPEQFRRWTAVFFQYNRLKERGLDVQLVSPRPGLQLVRINKNRKATK